MRNKLRNMVDRWSTTGLVVEFSFVDGTSLRGRVLEIDSDEAILEPLMEDGTAGALVVVNVHHVVTATYTDDDLPISSGEEEVELPADEPELLT